jgi:hypothetical protein
MKTLRLFINSELSKPINWILVNDTNIETGASSFNDLAGFDDVSLEIYLSTNCCSIFKTNVAGISSKRLTEELMLGLIEESLADEIDEVKAITLQVEDDIAYIAIFNKVYYETLMQLIHNLGKPVRFIQSFAFATIYNENCWTLFLSEEQHFIRTSKFQYYSLDDNKPIPTMLEDLLQLEKPESILVYADDSYNMEHLINNAGVKCTDAANQYEYGIPVWNFYIQKSTSFNIKLDPASSKSLFSLLKTVKYLALFLVLFWILDITMLLIDGIRIKSQINNNLKGVVAATEINRGIIQTANDKIANLRHLRGMYDNRDAVVLLTKFLQIVSTITPNDIKQFTYNNGEAEIILGSNFDNAQFNSYKDVLETRRVIATIEDYKTYSKKNKNKSEEANNNINAQTQVIDDAAWVIKLKPALWHEAIRNN